jgi:redox-sensitive bicupin YhaK (pirin superfamily)
MVKRRALAHADSLGCGSTIRPGELRGMSAGTGVQHSELNESQSALVIIRVKATSDAEVPMFDRAVDR